MLLEKKSKSIGALICIAIGVAILTGMMLPKNKKNAKINNLEIPRYTVERDGLRVAHTGYTVDFNADWHIPNWVAYELTADELQGEEERAKNFRPDPSLIDVCPDTKEYSHSGYDRGHMAPAADMKWSRKAMEESFYLSNVCPQLYNLNSGDWQELEIRVRRWASDFGSVYIVCGPIVNPGYQTIGSMKVAVPSAFYKVLLCQNKGQWQAIGFVFKHEAGHKKLVNYCKSIDEVEKMTGIDFFYLLDDKIENSIEASFSASDWKL
ncbi:MAG: DNA/RNA non-specific endonuclease [Bacteroidales bacterium]|nr:DNA/RNA non-specific endonuclease [Bacteroidales bacterium]